MDKQLMRKVTTLSFLGGAVVAYVVVNVLFKSLAGAFGVVQRWYSIDVLNHGLPIVAAVAVFAALQFNPKVLTWAEDVILEVSKVVWPSRKDTFAMAIVVCVFVGIACLLLMVIDFIAQNFVHMIVY